MLSEGQKAPEFSLEDQDGKTTTLQSLLGKPLVLYFYPKDNTPGCTKEACAFRDARADYEKAGARVVGISPDAPKSHRKFVDKFELNFPLLADPDHSVCEKYGVWKEKSMFRNTFMGIERTTFVIDAEGVIRKIYRRVKVSGHSDAVLEAVNALQP